MTEETLDTSTESTGEPPAEPSYFFADGIAGQGEKPDWLIDSKYKNVSEQAKGYNEIRKQLGAFTGAPENYEHFQPEGFELNPDDPVLESAREWAKGQNMNQDGFNSLVDMYAQVEAGKDQAAKDFADEQISQIDNFDERSNSVNNFLKANEMESLADMIGSKDQMEQFEKLLDMAGKGSINPDGEASTMPSEEEINALMFEKDEFGKQIYNYDKERQAKVRKMLEARVGRGDGRLMVG